MAMKPIIPVNVNNEMLSDASLMAADISFNSSTYVSSCEHQMSREAALRLINQLSQENFQLKVNLQDANIAMKNACEAMSAHKDNEKKKQRDMDERFTQAKAKIDSLKQTIVEKDQQIDELQIKQACSSSSSSACVDSQIENLKKTLVQANQLSLQYKQKLDQAGQQLVIEHSQRMSLVTQIEMSNKQIALLQEELSAAHLMINQQLKSRDEQQTDETQIVDSHRSHIATISASLKAEKDKNAIIQEQFIQLQMRHDVLLSDYHDLLVESDRKADKHGAADVIKNEQQIDNLTAQIYAAEDTLAIRDSQIDVLKQRLHGFDELQKLCTDLRESNDLLKEQNAVYMADFEAERKAREELNDKCLTLQETIMHLEREVSDLHLQLMQLRHMTSVTSRQTSSTAGAPIHQASSPVEPTLVTQPLETMVPVVSPGHIVMPAAATVDEPEMKCPLCSRIFPDFDSLTLHCSDCTSTSE